MGTFIQDGAAVLPPVKTDARPASGAVTEWAAGDANKERQALLDLRTEAIAEVLRRSVADGLLSDADAVLRAMILALPSTTLVGDASGALVTAIGSTTPRMLNERCADVVNVKDFGAVGNSIADDTAALQAAVDAAPDGAKVVFPPGIYTLGADGLDLLNRTDLLFDGGGGATIKITAVATDASYWVGHASIRMVGCSRVKMSGLNFTANGLDAIIVGMNGCTECEFVANDFTGKSGAAAMLWCNAGTRNRFVRNVFHDTTGVAHGIQIGHYSPSTDLEIDPLFEGNVARECGDGLVLVAHGGRVVGNLFEDNVGGVAFSGANSPNGAACYGITVTGNIFRRHGFHGLQSDAVVSSTDDLISGIVVTGNLFEENAGSGVYALNAKDWAITGNIARNNGEAGLTVDGLQGGVVSGNHCYDTRAGGARTQKIGIGAVSGKPADLFGVTISGNTCDNNTQYGIAVTCAVTGTLDAINVTGNTCRNNGQYGIFSVGNVPGDITRLLVSGNLCSGNGTYDIRVDPEDVAILGNQFVVCAGLAWAFADGDTTPSVKGRDIFGVANTAPTSITQFDDGATGKRITLTFANANTTIVSGTNIFLNGNVNATPTGASSMSFIKVGNSWYETGRSIL